MRALLTPATRVAFLVLTASLFVTEGRAESDQPTASLEGVSTDGDSGSRYRLFRTRNIWTLLELETATGLAWQVHFSLDGSPALKVLLNEISFLPSGAKPVPGRFTLYPTSHIYTFILLDRENGRTWQLQWSLERNDRGVQRIIALPE